MQEPVHTANMLQTCMEVNLNLIYGYWYVLLNTTTSTVLHVHSDIQTYNTHNRHKIILTKHLPVGHLNMFGFYSFCITGSYTSYTATTLTYRSPGYIVSVCLFVCYLAQAGAPLTSISQTFSWLSSMKSTLLYNVCLFVCLFIYYLAQAGAPLTSMSHTSSWLSSMKSTLLYNVCLFVCLLPGTGRSPVDLDEPHLQLAVQHEVNTAL